MFIDNEGKVQVVPGTDVDGPIKVTITDPDLVTPENPEGEDTITVPVEGHTAGQDDNKAPEQPEAPKSSSALTDEQRGRCIATGLGLGLPLLALVPIALASQVAIPGLPPVIQEVSARFQDANTALQQQLGVFQPQFAGQIDDINAQLKVFGADLTKVGTALAVVAAAILAGTLLFDACDTNGGFNSSKNESSSKK